MTTKLLFTLSTGFLTFGALAQTSNCDDTPGGQLTVGASCSPVTFNSTNNTDYWDDGWLWGVCNEDDLDDAWMWFDATSTSTTVTYTPSSGDPILTIFQGACSPTMSSNIACSDNIGLTAETVTFATVPGTRYRVRIQNWGSNNSMNGTVCAYSAGGGGGATTASDCSSSVNVCTNLSFSIDPNGYGAINEIPAAGSFGNPYYGPFDVYNPWGTTNYGCLRIGEYNSTWMVVNIATSGTLEFVFGGLGAQAGYYDWIMYPYSGPATCTAISSNTLAPIRCNWNAISSGGTGLTDVVPAGGDPGNFETPLAVTAGQRYIICFSNYSNSTTTVPLQFLTDPGNATVSCTPLGLSMEGLTVECMVDHRKIEWTSPAQENVVKFVVESSRDNEIWSEVATVYNGQEINGVKHFSAVDPSNPDELMYYQVKQYLPGGEILVSNVVSADCDNESNLFTIYPNPSKGEMQLRYKSATEASLQFFDVYGNLIYRQALEASPKAKTVALQATDVPAGMYMYKIVMDHEVKSGSIVITK